VSGLLIINADDWGHNPAATDNILACIEFGAVTSTSAMVYMEDSERAAELASRHDLSVGLHLNLTGRYTSSNVADDTRRRHDKLVSFFTTKRLAMWAYDPRIVGEVRACIADQLSEFSQLYGRDPSHINGHHHVHTSLSVLLSGALPSSIPLRRTFTFLPGEKPLANRLYRAMLNAAMSRRFLGTRYFVHLDSFVREARSGGHRFEGGPVEVLSHPEAEREQRYLMSADWLQLISDFRLGSYDLLRTPGVASV
jgi:chitin disaccharide deacetylase